MRHMAYHKHFGPLALPVLSFAAVILAGAVLLTLEACGTGKAVSFVDALFTATSAVCVTGLAVVDTGATYSTMGQMVILALIQLGGLGITTYSSLIFFLWRRRVSITDRLAVGQALLHDPSFHLGTFLQRVVVVVLCIEFSGAAALFIFGEGRIDVYAAIFHAISAFCNAGFGLMPDNLVSFRDNVGVNATIMLLIIFGGLGFSVLDECLSALRDRSVRLSRHSRLVLRTSVLLIVGGAAAIWCIEAWRSGNGMSRADLVLPALFQSVSARTAGFNTIDLGAVTHTTLLVIIFLMFVGGSPGSCAGGIKTTTFRVLAGFVTAQFKGRRQIILMDRAVDRATIEKALTLFLFATLTVVGGVTILTLTTDAVVDPSAPRFDFIDLLFETVSAFGTVGLSTGVTPHLTTGGKLCITLIMFVGRLGPLWLLTTLQSLQTEPKYRWPEMDMPIG